MVQAKVKPIVFCDFDGVLCHERYWRSLPAHEYEKVQNFLFGENMSLVNDWMRGKYSAEEVNQFLSKKLKISFEKLWDIFVHDCRTMHVPQNILERLSELRSRYTVILITDNMDSFSRFTQSALQLESYFDLISNSFSEGMHKTDNNGELFEKYSKYFGVSLEDSFVIDDSPRVCSSFENLGGTAYLVIPEKGIEDYLDKLKKINAQF